MWVAETQFSLRLNNHRKDARKPSPNAIPVSKHFHDNEHNFMRDAKVTIVEQIKNINKTTSEKRTLLMRRENFWINKLQTLWPEGFNKDLNFTN